MSLSLSYDELIAMNPPCDAPSRKYLFKDAERLTARRALAAGASISDLVWVAGRLGLQRQCVQFALACAQRVADLNTDPRVRAALDATQTWLDNPSDTNAAAASAAASAVNAAGAAAYGACTAASAVNAAAYAAAAGAAGAAAKAGNAAYASAYAACTAAYAAYADYAAANAASGAEREEQKKLFLEIFDPQ